MNTLPFAQPSDLFSDGLIYRFRVRPLTLAASNGDRAPFHPSGVARLRLLRPDRDQGAAPVVQDGTCTTPHRRIGFVSGRRPERRRARDTRVRRACVGTRSSWTPPRR